MTPDPRQYWAQSLDEAHRFMEQVYVYPVADTGTPFVHLPALAEEAGVQVEFSTSLNGGQFDRIFTLRTTLANDFVRAARAMNRRGWVLKVEDGYRTVEMQRGLAKMPSLFTAILERVRWELEGQVPDAAFMAKRVAVLVAPAPKLGTHMSGTAMDISVLDRATGLELDRGGPYLTMSHVTPMASPFVSEQARRNREAITDLMAECGFVAYPWEFWHYNQQDAYQAVLAGDHRPAPHGAVHWDPATNQVTPIADPCQPLNPPAVIQAEIESSLARLHAAPSDGRE